MDDGQILSDVDMGNELADMRHRGEGLCSAVAGLREDAGDEAAVNGVIIIMRDFVELVRGLEDRWDAERKRRSVLSA